MMDLTGFYLRAVLISIFSVLSIVTYTTCICDDSYVVNSIYEMMNLQILCDPSSRKEAARRICRCRESV